MAIVLIATFAFGMTLKHYQPGTMTDAQIEAFPLEKDGWIGKERKVADYVLEVLKPVAIFQADYVNSEGVTVNLFMDYFASEKGGGGPHSPRNCVPGSGWVIESDRPHAIKFGNRTIPAHRFVLARGDYKQVMDFWYVTKYGETANDYKFKLYAMLSSLTLSPTDVAFVRFVSDADPASLAALDQFEQSFLPEIYARLPFE
jgi:EpsI family protein